MAIEELQDADGENQAVRAFLALYGCAGGISVARMQMHMKRSGFRDCWPSWVSDALPEMPLTKGGAQDWIRHLFGLEQQASAKEAPAVVDGLPPLELPRPACTYADHSYPAYSARQVEQIARAYGEECARKAGAGQAVGTIIHMVCFAAIDPSENGKWREATEQVYLSFPDEYRRMLYTAAPAAAPFDSSKLLITPGRLKQITGLFEDADATINAEQFFEAVYKVIAECMARADVQIGSALAAVAQEPVGMFCQDGAGFYHQVPPAVVKHYPDDPGRTPLYAAPPAAQAGDAIARALQLREAIATVCEGWTLPSDARKVLETALWARPDIDTAMKEKP
ncbi:hypothetical protein [Herbaspirillum robiniae]|uniref:hypothetical protein n=1 Tax=Herbaspirillum robiniae TaxID=2014887 RepID=UPI0009A1F180|nr:hypothetical protein [Herbaspirillum robiniae]